MFSLSEADESQIHKNIGGIHISNAKNKPKILRVDLSTFFIFYSLRGGGLLHNVLFVQYAFLPIKEAEI